MDKITAQMLADILAHEAGVSKKQADTFVKASFEVLEETLMKGDYIKVNGLGNFKVVQVADRESVDVSTGERIMISGYRKVGFTPFANLDTAEPIAEESATESNVVKADVSPIPLATDNVVSVSEEVNPVNVVVPEPIDSNSQTLKMQKSNEASLAEHNTDAAEVELKKESAVVNHSVAESAPSNNENPVAPSLDVEADSVIEKAMSEVVVENVEVANDRFSAIDLIIATPESVDEVRQQLEEAKLKAEAAIDSAREAYRNKLQLEALLSRLENNDMLAESIVNAEDITPYADVLADAARGIASLHDDSPSESQNEGETIEAEETGKQVEEETSADTLERYLNDKPIHDEEEEEPSSPSLLGVFTRLVLGILLFCVVFYVGYYISQNAKIIRIDGGETPVMIDSLSDSLIVADSLANDSTLTDSIAIDSAKVIDSMASAVVRNAHEPLPTNTAESKPEAPTRPKTYKVRKGDSLTKIALKYYGAKDSLSLILRANTFANPNNVPIGTIINLP